MTMIKFSEASCQRCHEGSGYVGADYLCSHAVIARNVKPVRECHYVYRRDRWEMPSRYTVTLSDGRTRRVYVAAYGNGSAYVIVGGHPLWVRDDRHVMPENPTTEGK